MSCALLFGDVYPSGKLPITFPASEADWPTNTPERYPGVDGNVYYSEELEVGYRWYQAQGIEPLFPFGFGLSYTSFTMDQLAIPTSEISAGDSVTVQVRVRNTGQREGAEVVQVYVAYPEALGEPPKQLRAFEKVTLDAGGSQVVELTLGERALAIWDSEASEWVVNAGTYRVLVGSSSMNTPLESTVIVN
jgi:beta-glucosidase